MNKISSSLKKPAILLIPALLSLLSGCCGPYARGVQPIGPYGTSICPPQIHSCCNNAACSGAVCRPLLGRGLLARILFPGSGLLTRATYNDMNYVSPARRQMLACAPDQCADQCGEQYCAPTCVAPPNCAAPPVCAAPVVCAVPTCVVPPSCAVAATCVVPPTCAVPVSCAAPPTCVAPSCIAPVVCAPVDCTPDVCNPSCAVPPSCNVPVGCVLHTRWRPFGGLFAHSFAHTRHNLRTLQADTEVWLSNLFAPSHLHLHMPQSSLQVGSIARRTPTGRPGQFARSQQIAAKMRASQPAAQQPATLMASAAQPVKTDVASVATAKFPVAGLENKSDQEIEALYSKGMQQQSDGSWVPTAMTRPQVQQVSHEIPAFAPREQAVNLMVPEPAAESSQPTKKQGNFRAVKSHSHKRAIAKVSEGDLPQAPPSEK